jgi:hypothetical protein
MGTPTCPIQSLMNVFIPGGDSTFGIFAMRNASYDVHAAFTVSAALDTWLRGRQLHDLLSYAGSVIHPAAVITTGCCCDVVAAVTHCIMPKLD